MREKLEEIRQACIAANPSIMELGFGCIVDYYAPARQGRGMILRQREFNIGYEVWIPGCTFTLDPMHVTKILGRKIGLADVLLAIAWHGKKYDMLPDGWDLLKDDLRDQSEETISFIYSLLTK